MPMMHGSIAKSTRFDAVVHRTRRLVVQGPAGASGIRALSRTFGVADDCGGARLSAFDFRAALSAHGVELRAADMDAVLSALDRDGAGGVDPADFLAALRHDLTPVKRAWVARVWRRFPTDRRGAAAIADMAAAHSPHITDAPFGATFSADTNPDGAVTRQEFEQYAAGVAAGCADDGAFLAVFGGMWGFRVGGKEAVAFHADQSAEAKRAVNAACDEKVRVERVVCGAHRHAVMATPLAARNVSLALRDERTSGADFFCTREVFTAALWSQRLYLHEVENLDALDTCDDGTVDVLLYLKMLFPKLPPARTMMLERLWDVFPKNANGEVDVLELHKMFCAKDGEEKNAFLSAWDVRRALQHKVTFDEIVEWYTPMSARIQLDKDFDLLLKRQWNLPKS